MRLLVDTHCWLWYLLKPERLNPESRELLSDIDHEVYLSVASSWEIMIKTSLGKLSLPLPPAQYIPNRLTALAQKSLPIEDRHVLHLGQLPMHHKDPFDRILIAQTQVEGMCLVTADKMMALYEVSLLWAG